MVCDNFSSFCNTVIPSSAQDNNEAVAYGNEEGEKETVIDAIVLPQDVTDEETVGDH